ncbi:unnamed protein product [Anisakis simplex]|uniref:Ovule protein n=1 Tax=Anisakis simplex TaxID=6269 RepID=A0A0M3JJD3_ANISI|nr:unnamed protein product [Anisakis simplex]
MLLLRFSKLYRHSNSQHSLRWYLSRPYRLHHPSKPYHPHLPWNSRRSHLSHHPHHPHLPWNSRRSHHPHHHSCSHSSCTHLHNNSTTTIWHQINTRTEVAIIWDHSKGPTTRVLLNRPVHSLPRVPGLLRPFQSLLHRSPQNLKQKHPNQKQKCPNQKHHRHHLHHRHLRMHLRMLKSCSKIKSRNDRY